MLFKIYPLDVSAAEENDSGGSGSHSPNIDGDAPKLPEQLSEPLMEYINKIKQVHFYNCGIHIEFTKLSINISLKFV